MVKYALVFIYLWHNCNIIWADSNNCNLNSILVKQKRIVRLCTNSPWLAHTPPLFSQLKTLNIFDIHKLKVACFMFNFKVNNLPINFSNYFVKNSAIHNYPTRSSNLYRPAAFNYDLARNTIRTQGPLLWEGIPDVLKCTPSLKVFKCKYKKYLISKYWCCWVWWVLFLHFTIYSLSFVIM